MNEFITMKLSYNEQIKTYILVSSDNFHSQTFTITTHKLCLPVIQNALSEKPVITVNSKFEYLF